jgi:peptidoglycan/xylan/chitin deacetylase (PgdA/CDA1 family)
LDKTGALVISLDFELYWGVRDKKTLESYQENLLGVRQAIPALLELFRQYEIHATWAIVGFLFCQSREELSEAMPVILPAYSDPSLSPYEYLATEPIGANEIDDPYHYGLSLIRLLQSYPHQRIGSHTHSHYYCLEPGQTAEAFASDLAAFAKVARRRGVTPKSIVFPRNQCNPAYLGLLAGSGLTSYRGNEQSWMYRSAGKEGESLIKRAARLADAYLNLSGHNSSAEVRYGEEGLVDIPSSRFLRPYVPSFHWLERMRLQRIVGDLTYAAQRNHLYHLWWHPENFGKHLEENLRFLERVLDHFSLLREQYGMKSLSMEEAAAEWITREGAHEIPV